MRTTFRTFGPLGLLREGLFFYAHGKVIESFKNGQKQTKMRCNRRCNRRIFLRFSPYFERAVSGNEKDRKALILLAFRSLPFGPSGAI